MSFRLWRNSCAELRILSLPSIERPWRAGITAHSGICQHMPLPSIAHPAGARWMARSHRAHLLLDFSGYEQHPYTARRWILHVWAFLEGKKGGEREGRRCPGRLHRSPPQPQASCHTTRQRPGAPPHSPGGLQGQEQTASTRHDASSGSGISATAPNARFQPLGVAEARQERSNCLGCQGGLVYFFSFAPPAVARGSDGAASQ
jgi:hypothetical protein